MDEIQEWKSTKKLYLRENVKILKKVYSRTKKKNPSSFEMYLSINN